MLALGTLCATHAVLVLLHGNAQWGWPAYACLVLVAVLMLYRLQRTWRTPAYSLQWDREHGGFSICGHPGRYQLKQVWQGPFWITLGFAKLASPRSSLHFVVWKFSMSPRHWSELAMRIQAGQGRLQRQENKENHEPA